jgi:nucleotide-binding universal stress UspA family protein
MVGGTTSEISMYEFIRKDAEQALDEFMGEARKRGIDVRSARAERGHPAHAIVEAANQGTYDLIVLGTHGRTGLARVLIGSVAERVVRLAGCPVLTVRPRSTGSRAD